MKGGAIEKPRCLNKLTVAAKARGTMATSLFDKETLIREFLQIPSLASHIPRNTDKTKTQISSTIFINLVSSSLNMSSTTLKEMLARMKEPVRYSLLAIAQLAFIIHTFGLLTKLSLSNILLNAGLDSLKEFENLGLLKQQNIDMGFEFLHPILEVFLAALYMINMPLMSVINYVTARMYSLPTHKWVVLEIYFGLATAKISKTTSDALFYIASYLSQSFNGNHPFVDNDVVLLILRCLYESQDVSLCRQVHYELLKCQIYSYIITDLSKSDITALAYYLTTPDNTKWKIYCAKEELVSGLMTEVKKFQSQRNTRNTSVVVHKDQSMCFGNDNRIVVTIRSYEYVCTTLGEFMNQEITPAIQLEGSAVEVSSESSVIVTSDSIRRAPMTTVSSDPSVVVLLPYGHYTDEQYRVKKQIEIVTFFNMAKDYIVSQLQIYCPMLVIESQYRKRDHLWFMFSRNMRHDYYEAVILYPIIPVHWVKVQQPNGSKELEDKYRQVSVQRYQSPTAASAAESDTAELVILNSSRLIRCMVTPPTGEDPVVIPFYANSDEALEYGIIGCDYLLEDNLVTEDVRWKGAKLFDITCDEQVVRELPLPSKKGTEPGEMTANTAAANAANMNFSTKPVEVPKIQAGLPSFRQTIPPIQLTDQQIKRHALEGFDQPGYCFYGDGDKFVVGRVYTLPHLLPGARVLREGGNGTVLEVAYEGTVYAVKNTAFRWREVLIMPKLHHHNILPLLCMIMGNPIEMFPRRRYISHFYPRLTNDLGRNVGSYERFCLRSLRERYKIEPLLLKKIQLNFKYVSHEILQGLNYLHTLPNPIIHRDIKPSNVLLMMFCDCPNVLACVCRKRSNVVLSDFDASIELSPEGYMQPDPPRSTTKDFYTTTDRTYHISPVGTIGFKSPEGYIHQVSNSVDVIKELTTKADIFSFGLLMLLLVLNEEGPKYMNQIGTLLLSVYQSIRTPQPLNHAKKAMLVKNGVTEFRECEFCVVEADIFKIMPIKRLRQVFHDIPELVDFVEKALTIDPSNRASANELLNHEYITSNYVR